MVFLLWEQLSTLNGYENNSELSFKRSCVLRRWESETLKYIINHKVNKVN